METDQAYRRGAVLGLTIAEVFILLVFLLLLTLLLFMNQWEKSRKRSDAAEEEIVKLQSQLEEAERERIVEGEVRQALSVWKDPGNIPAPEEVETLHDRAGRTSEAEAERDNLIGKNEKLEEELRRAKEIMEAVEQDVDLIEKLQDRIEEAKKENMEKEGEIGKLEKELQEARKAEQDRKKELQEARQDLRIHKKGESPPCWYRIIKAENGKTREQHVFLLNIAVFDDAMIILPRRPPEGAAVDDGGEPYATEARRLPLADVPYGEPLKDGTLRKHLQPIYDMGKAAKVRTYPCKFSVLVWDKTSSGAKARWQQAHDEVLEGLFGTVRVKRDPWPGG